MAGSAPAAGSRMTSGVGPKERQQKPWPEEISLKLNRYAMMQAYLLMAVTGIGYLALTWSTVVLLGGFVTVLGKKDFWCLTFISMIQAASIFKDWEEGVMFNFFALMVPIMEEVLSYLIDLIEWTTRRPKNAWIILFLPIVYLLLPVLLVLLVLEVIYVFGAFICAGISLWRVIQRDYGTMDGDSTKANLIPALDLFYSLILCQGALYFLWFTSIFVVSSFVASRQVVCEFQEMWGRISLGNYLVDTRSKCWRDPKSMEDRRLIKYAVNLLDSESSQDYLSGSRMLDVFIKHEVDVRPLILPSSQKVQKLMDTLRWSSSDREIKELAARILAHLACDMDLTQFPGAIRCISSSLLGTTLPYWNNQQGSSNQSPQSKLDQQGAGDNQADRSATQLPWLNNQQGSSNQSLQSKLDQQGAGDSQGDCGTTQLPWLNSQQGSSNQSPQSRLDQEGAEDSLGDGWNELILQGLAILERLAFDQHNCRDICSTPDLIAKIMSPIYSDTLIQDINIKAWQDVVNGAFRVVHRLIRAPDRWLAREISCSKQAVSNLERILDQGNKASQELQMRAIEILTELALDPSDNLAMETKENLINKQLQIFLDEGKEEDLKVTAGKNLSANLAMETKKKLINKQLQEDLKVTAGKTLALLSKTGTLSLCIISDYNHIVDQVTETKKKAIYRTIAAEILENLCTLSLHTMDKNHVKNTLLPKVLTEVLITSEKKPPSEARFLPEESRSQVPRLFARLLCILRKTMSKSSGDVEENRQQDDEENQRLDVQINSSEQNETQTAMMELKEALLSLTSVIFDKLVISAEDFDDVARKVGPGESEFVAKLKTIVEENYEATANSLRIVKLCGQIAVTMMRRSQYNTHFKDEKFVEKLSKASRITCNLESCMLFAGTDCGAKKTARPLLSDLVKEAQALVP